jgi:hypothetical protein
LVEGFCRGAPGVSFAWSSVEFAGDEVEVVAVIPGKVSSFGEVLT